MSQDNLFNPADLLAQSINTPATVSHGDGSERFATLPDALAYLREHDLNTPYILLHALHGDRRIEGRQLTALVEILPEPLI